MNQVTKLREALERIAAANNVILSGVARAALTADASDQAQSKGAAECLNVMLWLYRRLPRAYERPPHIELPIKQLAAKLGVDLEADLAERGAAHGRAPSNAPVNDFDAFTSWAALHLGQGYSLNMEDGTFVDPVARWAFTAFKAGLKLRAPSTDSATFAMPDFGPLYSTRQNAKRYEFVRKLHPCDFEKLCSRNIAGEGKFDDLVDAAMKGEMP